MTLYDISYVLVLIGALISFIASVNVKSTYKRYSREYSRQGYKAEEVAEMMLRRAGITDVSIRQTGGNLTDHYDPRNKVLALSDAVYGSTSVAAIGVAAHECGHAIQDQEEYGPLKLRSLSVPVANFGSKLSWPVILLGLFINSPEVAQIGVVLFLFVVFFQLITLPVEFNASARALTVLRDDQILEGDELKSAGKVLGAAALTYVAALFTTIMQLMRIILIVTGGNRRDRR